MKHAIKQPTIDNTKELFKLSGMKYNQGYFTPEEWKEKTGVNPWDWAYHYINITRRGVCVWTKEAEKLYQAYRRQVSINQQIRGS